VKIKDLRDILVFVLVTAAWVFSTVYLFDHPTDTNFATWAGLCLTITGVYHWICMKDDKEKDAPCQ
jgi:di/tricarboxylate transporter